MILFLVNTTSQLINAIVLAKTVLKGENCDVYYTPEVNLGIDNLKKTDVFAHCYQIHLVPDLLKRTTEFNKAVVRIKNALDFPKVRKALPSDPMQYSRMFVSGLSLRNYEYYYAVKRANPQVKLSLFEEGAFEYYSLGLPKSRAKRLFSHFFFGHYYPEECDSLYVYNPAFVQNIWGNISVRRIPNYSRDKELVEILNYIYGYAAPILRPRKEKYLILEQAFGDEHQNAEQRVLINRIAEKLGKENMVIKLHPRSTEEKYRGEYECIKTSIPLELIIANENDTDKAIISVSSSAALNLKLIFDIEPYIVILNRLGRSEADLGPADQLYSQIRDSCREKHFWIPWTMEEFDEILDTIARSVAPEGDRKG